MSMPAPSAKRIASMMRVDLATANAARTVMKAATTRREVDNALDAMDKLFETSGVEAIRGDYHVDSYYYDVVALYLNTGDTYTATILYETDTDRWVLTSFGDWVESKERRYGLH